MMMNLQTINSVFGKMLRTIFCTALYSRHGFLAIRLCVVHFLGFLVIPLLLVIAEPVHAASLSLVKFSTLAEANPEFLRIEIWQQATALGCVEEFPALSQPNVLASLLSPIGWSELPYFVIFPHPNLLPKGEGTRFEALSRHISVGERVGVREEHSSPTTASSDSTRNPASPVSKADSLKADSLKKAAPIKPDTSGFTLPKMPAIPKEVLDAIPNVDSLKNKILNNGVVKDIMDAPKNLFNSIFGGDSKDKVNAVVDTTHYPVILAPRLPPYDSTTLAKLMQTAKPLYNLRAVRDSLGISTIRAAEGGARFRQLGEMNRYLSPGYGYTATLDSAASQKRAGYQPTMRVGESIFGVEVASPRNLPLQDYLALRRDYVSRKVQDSIFKHYEIKRSSKFELANILGQAGGLSIPIPQNPLTGIFGKPEIKLNVNMEINVRAGWRWDTQNLGTASALGQTQSSPIFSQDIQASINAQLGDKINIGLDQNTKRQFDFDNLFRIGFEGDADDIFKKVEIGNVQLNSPSTFINGSQALFGIRTDFQLGPVYLKMIASQKRGQSKKVSIKGGSIKQPFALHAYDYAENNFVVDTLHKEVFRQAYAAASPGKLQLDTLSTRMTIKTIEVWESTNDLREVIVSNAVAYADLPPKRANVPYFPDRESATITAGVIERGRFKKLESTKYNVDPFGRLTITQLRRDRTYAVAYSIDGPTASPYDDLDYGDLLGTTVDTTLKSKTLVLKLVYRPNMQPGFKSIWNRQLRNIYNIGASNVDIASTKIEFWYASKTNDSTDILPGTTEKLPTVLGVDKVTNSSGQTPPDGVFDIGTAGGAGTAFFNAARGEIIFPSLEPFRKGLQDYFVSKGKSVDDAKDLIFSAVYDTTKDVAKQQTGKDRFLISGEVSGAASNKITLPNAFNLSPGSVKVTLDGVPLQENVDFTVEYFTGQVTLLNPRASLPNANLDVEYEQNDPFNTATRTMLGLRADFDMPAILRSRSFKSNLGMTFMTYDQALIVDRVRPGEEPVHNTMAGIDGGFTWDTPWLTRLLDALPFFHTKAASSITARGEVAVMLPGPNKRSSNVDSDNGAPVAYIDDFEGGQRPISLNTIPALWSYASPPRDVTMDLGGINAVSDGLKHDIAASQYRGNLFWYRYTQPDVPAKNVYPNRATTYINPNVQPLYIDFTPDRRGVYNNNRLYQDSITYLNDSTRGATPEERRTKFGKDNTDKKLFYNNKDIREKNIWGGFMRLLSSFNTNFDNDNVEYIDVVMRIDEQDPTTKMYIDLGQISEDVIPNNVLNTEDGITSVNPIPNGIIGQGEEGEDVGIDMMSNAQERDSTLVSGGLVYPYPLNQEPDPARDDYAFNFNKVTDQIPQDFIFSNGLENNRTAQASSFPDTEVLNRNNGQTLSQDNSFFRYEVALNGNPLQAGQIINRTPAGWITLRIPVRSDQYRTKYGNPLLANVQYVRVWWKGGKFKGGIAEWAFVGSQWQRFRPQRSDGSVDNTHSLGFVSLENNSGAPDYYTLPPGVQRPRQLNNPDPNLDVPQNEQSLTFSVTNLPQKDTNTVKNPNLNERLTVRIFRPFDIFYYQQLKFFLHGAGDALPFTQTNVNTSVSAFVRFGTDSLNYYEYRIPLQRGWQDIGIALADLTAIKNERDAARQRIDSIYAPQPQAGKIGQFAVLGSPVLTRIQFIGFGIRNNSAIIKDLTTTMWVDELRLIEPDSRTSFAAVGAMTMKLADLGTVTATYNYQDPNFHRLEDRFGDRVKRERFSLSAQGSFEKFLPEGWSGTAIPVSYSHTESTETPEFQPQSDVNVATVALREGESAGTTNATKAMNAVFDRARTRVIEDQIALTGMRFMIPANGVLGFFTRELLGKFTLAADYAQRYETSPLVQERFRWQWKFNATYANSFQPLPIKPFGWASGIPILESLKDYTIFPYPSSIAMGLVMERSRITEQSRFLKDNSLPIRNFNTMRQIRFTWKMSENGLLNPTLEYALGIGSTLVPLELGLLNGTERREVMLGDILFNKGRLLNLGADVSYNQNVTLAFKPQVPVFLGGKFIDMTGNFGTAYSWQNILNEANPDLGKAAGFNNNWRLNATFRLKELGNRLFGGGAAEGSGESFSGIPAPAKGGSGTGNPVLDVFKVIFFDFDRVTFGINQINSSVNPGVRGGTGISNFWTRAPFGQTQNDGFGPSAWYQLGLITNPHGSFGLGQASAFPFFGIDSLDAIGSLRAPNALLQDNFRSKTGIELRMNRALWEGASMELNWKSDVEFNRNQTLQTDSIGRVNGLRNVVLTTTYNRTFLSFAGVPLLNFNSLESVKSRFADSLKVINDPNLKIDSVKRNERLLQALTNSFQDGLEAFAFLPRDLRQILPRVNWAFRWDNLEKLPFLQGIVRRASIEHAYKSTYQSSERRTDFGTVRDGAQVDVSFQPFIRLNAQFDEKAFDGLMTASLGYNTRNSFRVGGASPTTVARETSNEFTMNWSYSRRGFKLPTFLGMTFDNDIEFAFIALYRHSLTSTVDLLNFTSETGNRLDGKTTIQVEPSVRYTISKQVTARFFIRYEANLTEGAASPGSSTTQVGVDLRLSLSGGRGFGF